MGSSQHRVFESGRFYVERIDQELASGHVVTRDVIRHPGSVVILPRLDNGQVCLIRNFRIAVGQTLIELPAGTREMGESPAVTAARELTEETGYRAASIRHVASFFAAPGILDEEMQLYIADGLTAGPPLRDAGEQIQNLIVFHAEALRMIQAGEIRDAKSIIGLWWSDHPTSTPP